MIPDECIKCKYFTVDEITGLEICLVRLEPVEYAFKRLSEAGKCKFKEEASEDFVQDVDSGNIYVIRDSEIVRLGAG